MKSLNYVFIAALVFSGCGGGSQVMQISDNYKSDKIVMNDFCAVVNGNIVKNDLKSMILSELPKENSANPDSIFIHFFKNSLPEQFTYGTKLKWSIIDYSSLDKYQMKKMTIPGFEEPIFIPEDGSDLLSKSNFKYLVVFNNFELYEGNYYDKNAGNVANLFIRADVFVWDLVNKKTVAYGKPKGFHRFNNIFGKDIEEWNGAVHELLKSSFRETPLYFYW